MAITASQVKELREATGLGMMACKKALEEANGNTNVAVENLRKAGQATAAKRAGKAAKEGCITVTSADNATVVYEVNSETDFVARNDDFQKLVADLGTILLTSKPADMDAAKALTPDAFGGVSVGDKVTELVGKIGENISFRRFKLVEVDAASEKVFSYVHGAGKIGVLVTLGSDSADALANDATAELGKDIAMQVAASSPLAIDRDDVSADLVAKEKDIYLTQAQTSGKPEKVWDRIVEGKLNKFFKEVTLVEQEFIKDTDLTIKDRIAQTEKAAGGALKVKAITRYELGSED